MEFHYSRKLIYEYILIFDFDSFAKYIKNQIKLELFINNLVHLWWS